MVTKYKLDLDTVMMYLYAKFYVNMCTCCRDNERKLLVYGHTDRPTNRPTNQPTYRLTYRLTAAKQYAPPSSKGGIKSVEN